ncbi:NF038122 family metalloprotease [Sphingomonas metalli]|nr:NF038122 family metalloprotease [Sphingomonas metalli]
MLKAMALGAALVLGAGRASALTIVLTDSAPGMTAEARTGFTVAARYWESVLTNNVTLNIAIGLDDFGPNGLGVASSSYTGLTIADYYTQLAKTRSGSAVDQLAAAALPVLDSNGSIKVIVPNYADAVSASGVTAGYDSRLAPTNTFLSRGIGMTTANYKALFDDPNFDAAKTDAEILFSNSVTFDFNPEDGIAIGSADFIGTAIHEIGHALGFYSGVESFDQNAGSPDFPADNYVVGSALDLFRYSGEDRLDWTFGTDAYFSLDGGKTAYGGAHFATGETRGDGYGTGHWKKGRNCADLIGIMNPFLCPGRQGVVTGLDITALDAIGWNVAPGAASAAYRMDTGQIYAAYVAALPEPSCWLELCIGFLMLGMLLRQRYIRDDAAGSYRG